MRRFTKEEDDFLLNNYLVKPAKTMSRELGRSESSARQRMTVLGIIVPADVVQKFSEQSRFKKGNASFNKGKKQTEIMSADTIEKSKAFRFKKGNSPHNIKKNGQVVVRFLKLRDGNVRPYKWKKIANGVWKQLHIIKWEEKHGPVPPGKKVAFKNKDSMKVTLNNLELITTEENMKRNSIHNYPPEIKSSIRTLSKLKRKIKKHEEQTN